MPTSRVKTNFFLTFEIAAKCQNVCYQGWIQDLIRGAQIVTGLNCRWCAAASCERSEPFSAWVPGPTLGPQKLLGISLLNMHSLHFGVPFYTIFEIIKY